MQRDRVDGKNSRKNNLRRRRCRDSAEPGGRVGSQEGLSGRWLRPEQAHVLMGETLVDSCSSGAQSSFLSSGKLLLDASPPSPRASPAGMTVTCSCSGGQRVVRRSSVATACRAVCR